MHPPLKGRPNNCEIKCIQLFLTPAYPNKTLDTQRSLLCLMRCARYIFKSPLGGFHICPPFVLWGLRSLFFFRMPNSSRFVWPRIDVEISVIRRIVLGADLDFLSSAMALMGRKLKGEPLDLWKLLLFYTIRINSI